MPEETSNPATLQSVQAWLNWGADQLRHVADRPLLEAQILLAHACGRDRLWLITHPQSPLAAGTYPSAILRRADHEPLEYITTQASFYSRLFKVAAGVLIPRPETELLIDHALTAIENLPTPRIAEIGTGSGVIAVMIALLRPDATVVATDINPKAIALASENARLYSVKDRIEFVRTSLLDGIDKPFDLLISNPPYIAADALLQPHVLQEPHEALFGGEVGDELLREIIDLACQRGITTLACESGYDQRERLGAYLAAKSISRVDFYQDYAGLQRGFVARIDD